MSRPFWRNRKWRMRLGEIGWATMTLRGGAVLIALLYSARKTLRRRIDGDVGDMGMGVASDGR